MAAPRPIINGRNAALPPRLNGGSQGGAGLAAIDPTDRAQWSVYLNDKIEMAVSGWISSCSTDPSLAALANAWQNGGAAVLRRCVGDYALVVRDIDRSVVWLARSPLSSRPLFYCGERTDELVVATLAASVASAPRHLNRQSIINWYGGLVGSSVNSMFEGVERVEPGAVIQFTSERSRRTRFWDARTIEPDRSASDEDLAAGLRTALEAAIRDRIPATGQAASLLSAGRDSGCVSALTARLLQSEGRRLHCFTASPGDDPRFQATERLFDEWPGAAAVAKRYPNIDHHMVSPRNVRFCEEVEAVYRVHSAPLGNPLSLHWWVGAQRAAVELGCDTILTGGMGNLTISDGGPIYLADLAADGHWGAWWRATRDVASFEGASWLNVLNVSFGGRLPPAAYRTLQTLRGRFLPANVAPFLRGDFRRRLQAEHARQDQRPPSRSRPRGAELLTSMDVGDVSPDLMFGLAMADPTADRRVVEAALRIPPERLVSRYDRRPIFEMAFGDLLPRETIRAPRRAYQSMDWNLAYDVDELRDGLSRYGRHRLVAEILDLRAMEQTIDRWPHDGLASLDQTAEFGEGLLRAFALAAFFHVHFPC